MLMCFIRTWYNALIVVSNDISNGDHEIYVCKVEKIWDSQALPYTSDSIILMPRMSNDYSQEGIASTMHVCV